MLAVTALERMEKWQLSHPKARTAKSWLTNSSHVSAGRTMENRYCATQRGTSLTDLFLQEQGRREGGSTVGESSPHWIRIRFQTARTRAGTLDWQQTNWICAVRKWRVVPAVHQWRRAQAVNGWILSCHAKAHYWAFQRQIHSGNHVNWHTEIFDLFADDVPHTAWQSYLRQNRAPFVLYSCFDIQLCGRWGIYIEKSHAQNWLSKTNKKRCARSSLMRPKSFSHCCRSSPLISSVCFTC